MFLIAFGSSCARAGRGAPLPTAYEAHIDPTWPADRVVFVVQALDDWTAATGVHFDALYTADACLGNRPCFEICPTTHAALEAEGGGPNAVGITSGDLHTIGVAPLAPDVELHVLRHEIGHALGLRHVPDVGALMYPTTDGSPTITSEDVDQYRALR